MSHIRTLDKLVKIDAQDAALEAAAEGLDAARITVATTPSDLSHYPKNNRIWTGEMYKDLDADVRISGTTITAKVGWIKETENYFLIQEYGGKVGPKDVSPMHALANAQVTMIERLAEKGIE